MASATEYLTQRVRAQHQKRMEANKALLVRHGPRVLAQHRWAHLPLAHSADTVLAELCAEVAAQKRQTLGFIFQGLLASVHPTRLLLLNELAPWERRKALRARYLWLLRELPTDGMTYQFLLGFNNCRYARFWRSFTATKR